MSDLPTTNLFIAGFMGTGKTTVGRAAAHRLGFTFLDTDVEIEKRAGKPVPAIFSEDGEEAFRRHERELVEHGLPAQGCVVACGGGLIIPPGMLDLVRSRGVIVCLHATAETILHRTSSNNHRPLLDVEDPEGRIRSLLAAREPVYRLAGTGIFTDGRPLREVVDHVIRVYQRDARGWSA